MEEQPSLASLSTTDWRNILNAHHDSNIAIFKHARDYKAILKAFFRCKIASKQLNLLLNDQFFFNVFQDRKWRPYKRLFLKERAKALIILGNFAEYQNFYDSAAEYQCQSYFNAQSFYQFPLVVEKADLNFLQKFENLYYHTKFWGSGVYKAFKYACEQRDNRKLQILLRRHVRNSSGLAWSRINEIYTELGVPDKIMTKSYLRLIQIAHLNYTGDELKYQIDRLFNEKAKELPVIIPEGELLDLGKLLQSKDFKRKNTNFCVKYKKGNHVTLMYRDVNGTQHSIPIATTTDQSGAITQFSFGSESRATLSSLILHRSLSSLIFADYPHQLIAVTRELLSLPYEQQPWFQGIVSSAFSECVEIALEPCKTRVFYTYCLDDTIYLEFSRTTAYKTRGGGHFRHRVEISAAEDISAYFPADKFILGLHNGGEVNGLNEILVKQAFKRGDFEGLKKIVEERNVDLGKLNLQNNIIRKYLAGAKDHKINNDWVLWLLDHNALLPTTALDHSENYPQRTEHQFVLTCDDRVLQKFVEKGNSFSDKAAMTALMERGCSYDTLKLCWYRHNQYGEQSFLGDFFNNLGKNKFKTVNFEKRTLIMTAWTFDENCLFRKLPKEVVLEILRYDDIDDPPYWDFLDFVFSTVPKFVNHIDWAMSDAFLKIIPLVWARWHSPVYSQAKQKAVTQMCWADPNQLSERMANDLLNWVLKFLQRMPDPPHFSNTYQPPLAQYCLSTPNSIALAVYKLLIAKKVLTDQALTSIAQRSNLPVVFKLTVEGENKPMIEYIMQSGLWPTTVWTSHDCDDYFETHPEKQHVKEFITKYLTKRNNTSY